MRELAYIFDFLLLVYGLFESHAAFVLSTVRLVFGISASLTFTSIFFSVKFHESKNLPRKETFLQIYFAVAALLFILQMGLCFHDYRIAKAQYEAAACEFCFESIEPFAETVEDHYLLRCNGFSRTKRSSSHRRRPSHQTVAPTPPENMEDFILQNLMKKIENVLYSGEYDICEDEELKGEINEEKFKEVVFGTFISVTDNCKIARILPDDYKSFEALYSCAHPGNSSYSLKHSHLSDLVNFYVEKYAAENDVLDDKTQNIATAIFIFFILKVYLSLLRCAFIISDAEY